MLLNATLLAEFLDQPGPVARLVIAEVRGSSPREVGAEMFVRPRGLHGTIGGGQLEFRAIEAARAMLGSADLASRIEIPLGAEIGQCCGGRVTIEMKRMCPPDIRLAVAKARAEEQEFPAVYILGAGHVGRALAELFQHMPVRPILIDTRPDELAMNRAAVETRNTVLPEVDIADAAPGSAFIVLTHDHGLDFLLASAALKRGDAAYVGMIGSATKRAKFGNWARKCCDGQSVAELICPIGAGASRDKRPAVIAAFVVAEVMTALTCETAARQPRRRAASLIATR